MAYLKVGTGEAYATVQAAVNAAASGFTIGAGPTAGNTYAEAILINNKYVHLVGLVENQGILLAGAGGGAAPTVNVTGTGGVILENFTCSNVGSAHADVLTLNVFQHWVRRVRVNGTGGKVCFRAQFMENCMAYGGLDGFRPSCPGQNILKHVSVVDMTGLGIIANVLNGDLEACLVYNTALACITNALPAVCKWNFASDGSALGAEGRNYVSLADCSFINYGAGDIRLAADSALWVPGISPLAVDITGKRRLRNTARSPRIYAGAHDPYPAGPVWLSGASGIRVILP